MTYCWEKLSHLSKKFRLITLTFQFCLDRVKKVQIFTTSCKTFAMSTAKDGSKFWWLPWFPAQNNTCAKICNTVYSMDCQWCPRETPLGKTPRGLYSCLRGLSKASFIWKDASDPCKPTPGAFPRSLSQGHHWRSIVYLALTFCLGRS